MSKVKVTKESLFRTIKEVVKENSAANITTQDWPDKIKGNNDIIWRKTKEEKGIVNYVPYYRGHDIDPGGYNFGSPKEMANFIKNYILSNQIYNKLRYEPEKPLDEESATTGGANFTPGTGEQYATPKAFKKKVKESNTSAPFEKKFKHGTHPGAKAMDYKQLFEKPQQNISGIAQPKTLAQDAWDETVGYKSDLAGDIYKEGAAYTDFNHDRSALKSAFVQLYNNRVPDAKIVGDAYDALFEEDPNILVKLDAARKVIEKNAAVNKNYYLRAIDNIKAYLTQNLQESYSKFKTETKTRSKPEQFHQAIKGIKKKVHEINKLFEYSSQLKSELSEGEDQFKYGQRTEALIGKLQNNLREAFRKVSKFTNENQVEEVLTPDDYQKASEILKQIEDKSPKIYKAILDMVIDIYPHSHKEIEDLIQQSQINLSEKKIK